MIEKHIDLVKRQIAYYTRQIERFSPDKLGYKPNQAALYQKVLSEHQELLAFLEDLIRESLEPAPRPKSARQPDLFSEHSDLPEELLAQLSSRATRGQTDPLIQIINDRGGVATLDEILIGLYRKTGEIAKRNLLSNRLYRLAQQGLIQSVPNRKGVYTTADEIASET